MIWHFTNSSFLIAGWEEHMRRGPPPPHAYYAGYTEYDRREFDQYEKR